MLQQMLSYLADCCRGQGLIDRLTALLPRREPPAIPFNLGRESTPFNPGHPDKKLIPAALRRIADVKRMRREKPKHLHMMIDGKVSPETSPTKVRSGAAILAFRTSRIFNREGENFKESIAFIPEGA